MWLFTVWVLFPFLKFTYCVRCLLYWVVYYVFGTNSFYIILTKKVKTVCGLFKNILIIDTVYSACVLFFLKDQKSFLRLFRKIRYGKRIFIQRIMFLFLLRYIHFLLYYSLSIIFTPIKMTYWLSILYLTEFTRIIWITLHL